MGSETYDLEGGIRYLREFLETERNEILREIPEEGPPSSAYFRFLRTNRTRFYKNYIEALIETLKIGDSTSFLGNETFESYKCAKQGLDLSEVMAVPHAFRAAVNYVLSRKVEASPEERLMALEGKEWLDKILDEAGTIRAQSYAQTKEEIIRFFHASQEEIDRFPSNLAAVLDLDTLMDSAARELIKLVRGNNCAFMEKELASDKLHVVFANFDHTRVLGQGSFELDDDIVKTVIRDAQHCLIEGRDSGRPIMSAIMKRLETRTALIIPLKVRGRPVGALLLDSDESPHPFRPDLIKLAVRFCNQVGAAMENARLHQSEQKKIKEALALLEIARLMNSTLDVDTLLARVAQISVELSGVNKCSVYLHVEEEGLFFPAASHAKVPDMDWEPEMREGISWNDLGDEEAKLLSIGKEVWVVEPEVSPFIPEGVAGKFDISSLLIIPLASRGETSGLVVLYCSRDAEEVGDEWLSLCSAIAGQAAVALDNVSLYGKIETSYYNTVRALARAIEVKDPYTYGHSEKVTEFALAIARHIGLTDEELQVLKYGATLHDVGKIGISAKVLNKPGFLTDEEYILVKSHPLLGESILSPVEFLQAPRPIVRHHHERFDGRGYPDGYKGKDIPLMARIVAVADAFEAMLSERPYRKALQINEAIEELKKNAGKQFDPDVVEALLEVLELGRLRETAVAEESAASRKPQE